ncbi:hypothetical protein [Massilia orientalis]|uniref:Uncharacterized protein n=1 Tax=Massilia orientalis TaxID=3050128 RepID=A0ACC7MGA6_9BURK|nr:hypothetical protein [Massilia sp. YIM B02787]
MTASIGVTVSDTSYSPASFLTVRAKLTAVDPGRSVRTFVLKIGSGSDASSNSAMRATGSTGDSVAMLASPSTGDMVVALLEAFAAAIAQPLAPPIRMPPMSAATTR